MAPVRRDITAELTHALEGGQGPAYPWIIGQDFGWQVNASIVLKAFADGPERAWFALDEVLAPDPTLTSRITRSFDGLACAPARRRDRASTRNTVSGWSTRSCATRPGTGGSFSPVTPNAP